MNYRNFTTEDFIIDEKFIHWVKQPDRDSNTFWNQWLSENADRANVLAEARLFVEAMQAEEEILEDEQMMGMLKQIHQEIDSPVSLTRSKPQRSLGRPWYVAASVALLVMVSSAILWLGGASVDYETAFSETRQIVLPDGSAVTLNANSRIKVKEEWTKEEDREVWLEGEAFFSVTNRPAVGGAKFVVHAGDIDVKVLGTKFNVNARKSETSVVLSEGKIQLSAPASGKKEKQLTAVRPGERVVYTTDQLLEKAKVNTLVYTSWVNHKLVFDDTPFIHLIRILENNYGYQVELGDAAILLKKLTGNHPGDQPEVLIKSIALALNLTITQKGDKKIKIDLKE